MEESTATHQHASAAPPDDPFAEVPADLGAEGDLPPGVQPGTLGGDNPSEEAAQQQADADAAAAADAEAASADPLAEDLSGGEFMEEPPEPDDFEPEQPVAEEPIEEPVPEPEAAPEPETPVAESPPPEEPEAPPVAEEPEPPAEPEAEAEVPTAPVEEPPPAPPAEDPPPPTPDAEPEPQPESEQPPVAEDPPSEEPKPKRKRKPRKKKTEKGQRGYVILKLDSARAEQTVGGDECPSWVEAFEREVPIGEDGSEPVTIDSRGGEMALRMAYRRLSENGEGSYTLVAVPAKLFKPKRVEGKVPEDALTIKVN